MLAYALGFASGNYIGICIEEEIALGNFIAQVVLNSNKNGKLLHSLRDNGFGVTSVRGFGREGTREILNIALKRKDLDKLTEILDEYDEKAFITVNNTKPIRGGYFALNKK